MKSSIPHQVEEKSMETDTTVWSDFPNGWKATAEQIFES